MNWSPRLQHPNPDRHPQHGDDWFFFHELRWTIESPTGTTLRFHTAEYAEVSPTGLVVARTGHGTDPIRLT